MSQPFSAGLLYLLSHSDVDFNARLCNMLREFSVLLDYDFHMGLLIKVPYRVVLLYVFCAQRMEIMRAVVVQVHHVLHTMLELIPSVHLVDTCGDCDRC